MAFKFESLQIWQMAFRLSGEIHQLALTFPNIELFSLTKQIKKAADSVVLNIAEGSTGQTNPEYKRFLNMALRSAIEVVGCLMISDQRSYTNKDQYQHLYDEYEILCKRITTFRDNLK